MKRALVSVTDKTNLIPFCKELRNLDFEIVSTGGTLRVLEEGGIKVIPIDDVTSFPEILDGRVKTLHPKVHGGILCRRELEDDMKTVDEMDICPIDLVCVNLYNFEKALREGQEIEQIVESIDIGGPSMIRSAAKNFKNVLVVSDVNQYEDVIEALKNNNDTYDFRKHLAYEAFSKTASYDCLISRYFKDECNELFPETLNISLKKVSHLRYGENSQQKANLYKDSYVNKTLLDYEQLNGKEISFNNMNDLYGAVALVREFRDQTVTAAIKHSTPCGVAVCKTGYDSYVKAYEADPVSIFGGIVATNYKIDKKTAEKMSEIFLEIVTAPDFDEEALQILKKKKNLRVLKLKNEDVYEAQYDIKYLEGNVLVQTLNKELIEKENVVTKAQPTKSQLQDMEFGLRVVKYAKSNAICIVKNGVTLAIDGGETSRIWALENALRNNPNKDFKDAVLVSDAFFPFDDCVRVAAEAGITAVVQPGGSIRDNDSIDACNEKGLTMVFTGYRHFRH